jgi:hypothetical protein
MAAYLLRYLAQSQTPKTHGHWEVIFMLKSTLPFPLMEKGSENQA